MNQKKVKAIRHAMRAEIEKGSHYIWKAHPKLYTNVHDQTMLKYTFQYMVQGGIKLVKIAKKIYRLSGILPRRQNG